MSPGVGERFELERQLGRGGGGEVWAARDRATGRAVALKLLHQASGSAEADALVRETIALSGLEGLGFPRVLWVGRSPDGRLFLARELIEGDSLEQVAAEDPKRALSLLCAAADALTVVHRAGLLHGDVKPANVIVRPSGEVAWVDLGLTAAWAAGETSSGLTPHYAAPEVHAGQPVSPQSEVFSLGVTVRDLLEQGADAGRSQEQSQQLAAVMERATNPEPAARFPSADEFSQALRSALGGDAPTVTPATPWPVLGLDSVVYELERRLQQLPAGGTLWLVAPPGAGASTLLRRFGWSLALAHTDVALIEGDSLELAQKDVRRCSCPGGIILVDGDGASLQPALRDAMTAGARVVRLSDSSSALPGREEASYDLPELDAATVHRLLQGAMPGIQESLIDVVVGRVGARPGSLRRFVTAAEARPVVSEQDVDEILAGTAAGSQQPLIDAERALDRGHFDVAARLLERVDHENPHAAWLEARCQLATGAPQKALELLDTLLERGVESQAERCRYETTRARALLGLGRYQESVDALSELESFPQPTRAEAWSYRGLAEALLGRGEVAVTTLQRAVAEAEESGSQRMVSLAESSLATAQWRSGHIDQAVDTYRRAMAAAVACGDAGILTSSQINLAGLLKERGDLAESIRLLEAAVDTAERAGRTSSVRQARLNLSNTNLYLGRLERARADIYRIGSPEDVSGAQRAQLYGLRAELAARRGDLEAALPDFEACERAWAELGRRRDASEAPLEAVLSISTGAKAGGVRGFAPSLKLVGELVERGRRLLDGQETPLLRLAEARAAQLAGESHRAEQLAETARSLAEEASQREWAWRAAALQAELWQAAGQRTKAQRAREQAVEILEEISARLPDDLASVYWSDPRRAALRGGTEEPARPSLRPAMFVRSGRITTSAGSDVVSRMSQTPLERRLARILAINSDLAGEANLARLAEKIVAHASELLHAERGYLLLGGHADELEVCAARGGQGAEHEGFSRSLASRVLASGQPLVSIDAERDQRLRAFESVHLDLVSAVACVPILSPQGVAVGALYLETRAGVRPDFAEELPTLQAFADQAAIALSNARLLGELQAKGRELEEKNKRLTEARSRLQETLGRRNQRLREVRQKLRTTRDQLASHSSYRGLVGASAAMRRLYALIERIKDTDVPVLITGESGTGKEMVARAIFEGSERAKGKLLAVNCGAIPESILESELFGHVRGAFTGAARDRRGLFRDAEGGMLFLDEIGETPLKMQTSLLRVLQEKRVRPVGGSEEVPIDVRVVFATNRDLRTAVEQGRFREDLLYRIQVVEVALPPLRERREDIPLLADHFLERFAARFGQDKKPLTRAAAMRLMAHSLPGNVRQLENVLLNAWVMAEGDAIEEGDLELPSETNSMPPGALRPGHSVLPQVASADPEAGRSAGTSADREVRPATGSLARGRRPATLSEHQRIERDQIVDALEQTGWNRVRAAELLGMPRRTFYRRLKEYEIQ